MVTRETINALNYAAFPFTVQELDAAYSYYKLKYEGYGLKKGAMSHIQLKNFGRHK